ncbi:polyprenyl synthetase family protein [Actinocatenispora sera]|nr:polyprenyl synthetase family protein [Actinocatenispora sera]
MDVTATVSARARAEFIALTGARLGELTAAVPEPLGTPVRALAERPGKRLRSVLLHAAAVGATNPHLVRLAALVELLHLASLLHDDVVDRGTSRRGAPSARATVGDELATLAGLACFALAGREAAELGDGLETVVARAAAGLAYGEILDVERAFDIDLSLPDYLELVERKTGDLFRLSCSLGAAAAGADSGTLAASGRFGAELGVAFQILDDCLDLATIESGKPVGTDHLLGLFGAPTLFALAADGTGELATLLLDPAFDRDDLPAVRAHVTASGGLAAAHELAQDRYQIALAALDGVDSPRRTSLTEVAAMIWPESA